MGKHESRFDKRKCATCMFSSRISSYTNVNVCCNYAKTSRHTCLQMIDGKVVDTRGDDYYKCKLYTRGVPEKVALY